MEKYVTPKMEVIKFETVDVIVTSGGPLDRGQDIDE